MSFYKQWSVNEIAKVIYYKYKGLTYPQIAEVLGRTEGSITAMAYQLKDPSRAGKNMQKMIDRAGIFELQVRGGQYPKERDMWDEKASDVTGITYSYVPTVQVSPDQEADDEVDNEAEITFAKWGKPETEQAKPIVLTVDELIKIIKAVKE